MYQYQCLNPISQVGLDDLQKRMYTSRRKMSRCHSGKKCEDARHGACPELKAIARAGAGVNNIPLEKCAEKGIVVFNTPGSQCKWCKRAGSCRDASCFPRYHRRYQLGSRMKRKKKRSPKLAEKQKNSLPDARSGKEAWYHRSWCHRSDGGKRCYHLGMEVYGYDPYISIDAAWNLSRTIKHSKAWMRFIASVITSPSMYLSTAQNAR